jgi:hypothetical protein
MTIKDDIAKLAPRSAMLGQLDDGITNALTAIETSLRDQVRLGVRISVAIGPDDQLAFGKLGGAWRLVVVHGTHETPLACTSREMRVRIVRDGAIEKLVREAVPQLDAMIEQRKQAIVEAEKLLVALSGTEVA